MNAPVDHIVPLSPKFHLTAFGPKLYSLTFRPEWIDNHGFLTGLMDVRRQLRGLVPQASVIVGIYPCPTVRETTGCKIFTLRPCQDGLNAGTPAWTLEQEMYAYDGSTAYFNAQGDTIFVKNHDKKITQAVFRRFLSQGLSDDQWLLTEKLVLRRENIDYQNRPLNTDFLWLRLGYALRKAWERHYGEAWLAAHKAESSETVVAIISSRSTNPGHNRGGRLGAGWAAIAHNTFMAADYATGPMGVHFARAPTDAEQRLYKDVMSTKMDISKRDYEYYMEESRAIWRDCDGK